jgi:plastocyanin
MKKFVTFIGVTLVLAALIAACSGAKSQISNKEYVLTTELKDGNLIFLGVSDEINGLPNPTLSANPGETITVTLINGGMGEHDITFPSIKASTEIVKEKGQETSITFTVPNKDGILEYYDGVGNHAKLGMRGALLVGAAVMPEASSGDPQVLAEVVIRSRAFRMH